MDKILGLLFALWFESFLNCIMKFGQGLEVVSGFATAPGATLTAWTVATGNSLQIRSANFNKPVWLLGAWAFNQVAGVMRVRSPRLHDFVQGLRMRVSAANAEPLYPDSVGYGWKQPLIPQDVLVVEHSGSAVGGQIETGSLLVYYEDLPGIAGRFIDSDLLEKAGVNIIGQELSITTGVAGGYSGQVAINVTNDNFKANTDYALLGGMVDVRAGTIRVQGVDTGNLGVGFPAEPTQRHVTSNWFQRLSVAMRRPLIPVFNSANKTAILVDATGNQGAITTVVTLFMVELKAGMAPAAVQTPMLSS
jgi:hypothetical protein